MSRGERRSGAEPLRTAGERSEHERRVLITSGGTREPIDGVRFVTNFSSGVTGAALADAFGSAGWSVALVRSVDACRPADDRIEQVVFGSVADLDATCARLLGERPFDAVLHAAAVSDYTVTAVVIDGVRHAAPLSGKLDSAKGLSVELSPSRKILPRLKTYGVGRPLLVGFKLTNGSSVPEQLAAVQAQLDRTDVDLVVHNDLTEIDHGAGRHVSTVYDRQGVVGRGTTNEELAAIMLDALDRRMSTP